VLLGYVMLVFCEGFVAGDGDYLDAGHLVLEGLEAGHFFDAGSTPAGPEVDHDYFALKTLQVDGVLAVVEGEGGGGAANLIIEGPSVAAGGEGAEYGNQEGCTCNLPHKVFVLALFL